MDSSAVVKLVIKEDESAALLAFLQRYSVSRRFSADLARVEVVRAVRLRGGNLALAFAQMRRLRLLPMDRELLQRAGEARPDRLRSLYAIHLAAASQVRGLGAFVTYDLRLGDAAQALGMPVVAPNG